MASVRGIAAVLRAIALAAALAGCASGQSHDLLSKASVARPSGAIAATHEIYIATTRARSKDRAQVFDGQRSPTVSFARVAVSVPQVHKTGAIERPKGRPADAGKYFTATGINGYDSRKSFQAALRADIAAHGGRAMVFIHGYNTQFDDAVYRVTQIAHDSGYTGTSVLFSWASGGRTIDYIYDRDSANAARDSLEETLRTVVAAGATRVDIIAHSMGNLVTMEALRQLAMTGDRDLNGKLGDVVLASPDIDVDVFKSQMRRYGKPDKPFFVLLSRDDRALGISQIIAGNRPRLGGYTDDADIASYGVIVVDLTKASSGDRLNHAKFADNPLLVKLLGDRLQAGEGLADNEHDISDRIGLLARGLGQTVTSAAEIVITTPLEVLSVATGN